MLKKVCGWLGGGLGYLLYVTGVLVLLVWLLFPKEAMRRFVEESLGRACPELRWQAATVALEMPAGLMLRMIEGYGTREDKKPLVRVDVVTLQPQVVKSLRAGRVQVGYRMAIGKGSVVGWVRRQDGGEGLQAEGTVLDLKLADIPLLSRQLGRALQGTVSGTFSADVARTREAHFVLEARIQVENGRLGLKRPILSHRELSFSQGSVILRGHGETLQLEQGVVESELFDGRFSGTITMHGDPILSQIDVKGTMQPKNKFFKGLDNTVALQAFRMRLKEAPLPFRITGDLLNPGIHYEELAMLVQTLEKELK
jgi:type II secretion system protein N